MRIAVIDKEKCRPDKCGQPCVKVCPRNRAGEKCLFIEGKAVIDESLCIGCGLCVKKCPYNAIQVVNTPEKLKEAPIHRFGTNGFALFRLPFPIKGEVVGLLGPNGVGKTTALKILSGEIKPNLGTDSESSVKDLIKIFRGTELQSYLERLEKGDVKAVVKPQHVDILSTVNGTVKEILEKYDERGKIGEIVKELGIEKILDSELKNLSGGELQRVAIAIASNRKADIYYFDEPSSYLDVFQRLQMAKLIRQLAKESAVIVVEHDLATLDVIADRIHIFYGVPGAFGIVSKPYSTRNGINIFLDGYIKEDNVRIRPEALDFKFRKTIEHGEEKILEWTEIYKKVGNFELSVTPGELYKNEVLGIFGANALGKTTFAKILAGELEPDEGKISSKIKISYKPQYISTDFDGTVSELLSKFANIYSEDYRSNIFRPLFLERILENRIKNLSGGELQRVAIAIALSRKADVYLLDEPSAYLDVEQRLSFAKMLRKFAESKECSVMIIDHDLLLLSYLADNSIVFTGEPSVKGFAQRYSLQDGFNVFLKEVNVTFRKDPETGRPRANKPGSQLDREQREKGMYYFIG